MNGILVTNYDDWEALYINGKVLTQGHKVSRADIRKVKGKLFEQGVDNEHTYEVGYLPDNYADIPEEAFLDEPTEVE